MSQAIGDDGAAGSSAPSWAEAAITSVAVADRVCNLGNGKEQTGPRLDRSPLTGLDILAGRTTDPGACRLDARLSGPQPLLPRPASRPRKAARFHRLGARAGRLGRRGRRPFARIRFALFVLLRSWRPADVFDTVRAFGRRRLRAPPCIGCARFAQTRFTC